MSVSIIMLCLVSLTFFFRDTATPEIYTLSLHAALPILAAHGVDVRAAPGRREGERQRVLGEAVDRLHRLAAEAAGRERSEEHTSELQSRLHLVCRLLLEKKKNNYIALA